MGPWVWQSVLLMVSSISAAKLSRTQQAGLLLRDMIPKFTGNSGTIAHRDAPLLDILVLHYVIWRVADDVALSGGQRLSQKRSPCLPIRIHAASLSLWNTFTKKICNCLTSLRRRR